MSKTMSIDWIDVADELDEHVYVVKGVLELAGSLTLGDRMYDVDGKAVGTLLLDASQRMDIIQDLSHRLLRNGDRTLKALDV
jgi:hypothetical protein